jgi:hypothetical protein
MGNQSMRKKHTDLITVAAGAAADATAYTYLTCSPFRKTGFQLEWIAGAGGGTIAVTIEGTMQEGSDRTALQYQDITNATFGVANWSDDFMAVDQQEKLAVYSYIRVKTVVANKDASTAYTLDVNQVG